MSKIKSGKFSCLIIGSKTLSIRCAEILLSAGHSICAIVSADEEVQRWARKNKVSYLLPGKHLAEQIDQPFDYLFSIVNDHILREDLLRFPRKMGINYHDAPLPRYAGTHATSWALLNGEAVHGISWHLITDMVDAGDILKQELVEVAKNETALTLNTKCYEAAIKSFAELVEDLASDSVVAVKQNLAERTFFPRFKRPADGGVISWNKPAAEISRLVRALNFGNYPNPLGVAKVAVGNEFLIVSELNIHDSKSTSSAGTINEIGKDFLRISTGDREIILGRMMKLDGRFVTMSSLIAEFNLQQGTQLPSPAEETLEQVEANYKINCHHESYWVTKLSTFDPAVPPLANLAVVSNSASYERVRLSLPDEILRPGYFSSTSQTFGDFLLAAFGAFLARLNGVDNFDIAYCSEAQREVSAPEKLFATLVPFRFNIDCLQSFTILLASVRQEMEAVENHKTYARDLIARFPQLRSASEAGEKFSPPVAFVKVKTPEDFSPEIGTELCLVVSENEPECYWVYDRNRICAEDAQKLRGWLVTFTKGLVLDPESPIALLPLLTKEETHRLIFEWNNNRREYPNDLCIHQLFEAQVRRTPDNIALIFGTERLTYRELNSRSNSLARHLKKLGVGPEVLVGVCLPRSVQLVVSILGILKAGGAYIPLDPFYPADRLTYMLEDSRATVLLTQEKLSVELNRQGTVVVCLDVDWPRISQEPSENLSEPVSQKNLAYVIYTSGSTGRPKGVAIEHRNTVAFLSWANSVFTPQQLKGTLASTSVCFDLSVFEMFAPLSCGGTVILVENILHLPTVPAASEVTLINTVPSAINELLRIRGIPASVRTVNLAGEPLKSSLVRQIYECEYVQEVFDLYGPTEDTTYSTFTLRDGGRATIGRPIANTQAYILDRRLQLVPVGIPGELFLGGDGLARGYLNRPELTAERFIENPFGSAPQDRLYKTGDLVRYLASGEIEYLGRIDNQVKIRGFRIELGEIETMLLAHPRISEAVVVAREDQPGDKRLAAYFVPKKAQTVIINDLRDYLKQKLPDYMVPSAFVELAEMPLTPNGKINRKALPIPNATLSEAERSFVTPRDDLESQLVGIWESILGVHPIGVRDNFFELGGHSLQAVRMFAEVEEAFGKNIPLATLFESGTIEKLADILRRDEWVERESSIVPIQTEGAKPPFFCIHARGGNVLFYRDLAKHLGKEQPFYGIQARRLGGRQIGHSTVEEMAEFYLREIRTLQPEGPYYLGGASFGGLAAFEMAQQLYRQGQKVGLLALFDTGTPDYPKILPTTTAFRLQIYALVRRIQHHRDSLRAFDTQEKINYLFDKLKKVRLKYRRKIMTAYKKVARKYYSRTKGPLPAKYILIEDQIWKAGQNYQPQIYPGELTLFRASNQPLGIEPDATLGWGRFVSSEIEIHEVPGHHGSIVAEPYVRILAEKLSGCLALAQTEAAGASEKLIASKSARHEVELAVQVIQC